MNRKNTKTVIVIVVLLLVFSGVVISRIGNVSATGNDPPAEPKVAGDQGETDAQAGKAVFEESVVFSLAKLLGALVIVVAGIYGFLYVLRRMMGQKFSGNRRDNLIEVLETAYVAQKKTVSLVRFHDRAVLIGVGESGINALAELNPEETARIMADFSNEKSAPGFKGVLKDARSKLMSLNMGKLKAQVARDPKRPQTA
ncbi:MAG: flagellar biosynthetic protein FliO [Candidatus Zixiibacteriota bacterium]|nr:MAG: flagellar biosynthetic protein FliO [candidate division Zixibacteria bacterium]